MIGRLRGTSLRARVTLTSVAILAVAVLALDVFVYASLDARMTADLRSRLQERATLAERLAPDLSPQRLAERLSAGGVEVRLVRAGRIVGAAHPFPPDAMFGGRGYPGAPGRGFGSGGRSAADADAGAAGPSVTSAGGSPPGADAETLVRTLSGGTRLTLTAGRRPITDTLSRVLVLELIGSALVLGLAALALWRMLGVALRPLDRMTEVALRIARGTSDERLGRLDAGASDTEIGRTAAAFDEMLDSLQGSLERSREAERRLRAFLADASHELRTPVAGVQAGAEILLREDPSRAEREALAVQIVRESRRASRLVDDLLEAARLSDGGWAALVSARDRVDLAAVAREEADRAATGGGPVELRGAGAPVAVLGDRRRLGQVVANLLENARHAAGPDGRVALALECDDARVRLSVEDDGPGVPEADRERIFERFVRLDAARSRGRFGSGLGLAIARGLAEAMGGRLTCEEAALGGARFALELPPASGSATGDGPVVRRPVGIGMD